MTRRIGLISLVLVLFIVAALALVVPRDTMTAPRASPDVSLQTLFTSDDPNGTLLLPASLPTADLTSGAITVSNSDLTTDGAARAGPLYFLENTLTDVADPVTDSGGLITSTASDVANDSFVIYSTADYVRAGPDQLTAVLPSGVIIVFGLLLVLGVIAIPRAFSRISELSDDGDKNTYKRSRHLGLTTGRVALNSLFGSLMNPSTGSQLLA